MHKFSRSVGIASYAALGHVPTLALDFQLFNLSGHFRAAQTLTLDSINYGCLPKKNIQASSFVTVHCINFILFWCVILKLFSFLVLCPSLHEILAMLMSRSVRVHD